MLQKRHSHSWAWIPPPGLYSVGWYLKFLFNESRTLPALAIDVGVAALVKVAMARRSLRQGASESPLSERPLGGLSPSLVLALWLAVPFAGAVAVSYAAFPLLTNRNLLVCLPAAYLLLARAFAVLASGVRLALLASVATLLLLAHLLFVYRFYAVPEKEQFRGGRRGGRLRGRPARRPIPASSSSAAPSTATTSITTSRGSARAAGSTSWPATTPASPRRATSSTAPARGKSGCCAAIARSARRSSPSSAAATPSASTWRCSGANVWRFETAVQPAAGRPRP